MQLYLIRHPKPGAVEGRCYGRLDLQIDSGALATTLANVRQTIPADVLRTAPIFTSPLSRCADLAKALARPRSPKVASALIEMDFGSWEGRYWNEIPRAGLDAWAQDIWQYKPGGGENAEDLATRWRKWCDRIRLTHRGPVIAVTHAGIIRVALALAGQLTLADLSSATIEFGSVHRISDAKAPLESAPEIAADA
jgi:alpha-ribazole phosphatase